MTRVGSAEFLEGVTKHDLSIEDLDRRLRLKLRTTLRICMPAMYVAFARHIDVGSMRRRGIVSFISFAEFDDMPTPLPVGGTLEIRYRIKLCRSGIEGGEATRLSLVMELELVGCAGTGDPRRYRELAPGAEPAVVGRAQIVLVLTRPAADARARLVSEAPEELSMLAEQLVPDALVGGASLEEVPAGFQPLEVSPNADLGLIWGIHHTDVNQAVYTGEYITTAEDFAARLLARVRPAVGQSFNARVRVTFKRPFRDGDAYGLRGRLFVRDEDVLVLAGYHVAPSGGDLEIRPGVSLRLEGRLEGRRDPASAPPREG